MKRRLKKRTMSPSPSRNQIRSLSLSRNRNQIRSLSPNRNLSRNLSRNRNLSQNQNQSRNLSRNRNLSRSQNQSRRKRAFSPACSEAEAGRPDKPYGRRQQPATGRCYVRHHHFLNEKK
jgi:hypothetical protein